MTKYKKIGFFYEESQNDQHSHLSALRNDLPHPAETEILQYLSSGIDAGVCMLIEHDYLKMPPKFLGSATLLSDGEWLWPKSLTYYVREYHISLPEEFVIKMKQQNWCVSPDTKLTPKVPEGDIKM